MKPVLMDLGKILGWRAAVALVSFVANLIATRLILERITLEEYAGVALLISIPALLPFADLGMGATIVNAAEDLSARGAHDRARRAIAATARLLVASAAVLIAVAILLLVCGAWPNLLGPAASQSVNLAPFATLVVALYASVVPLTLAARMLQGWRQNARLIAISIAGPPLMLLALLIISAAPLPPPALALPATLALVGVSFANWIPVIRREPALLGWIARTRVRGRDYKGSLLMGIFGLIVSMTTVALLQSDRLILSFADGARSVAAYSLVAPLYAAAWSVLNPIALNFWPKYRRQLSDRTLRLAHVGRDTALLVGIALVGAVAIGTIGPLVVRIAAQNEADSVAGTVYWGLGALLVVQAAALPATMVLTDRRGFLTQIPIAAIALIMKAVVATPLVGALGAAGAPLSTCVAIAIVQVPTIWFAASRRILVSQ